MSWKRYERLNSGHKRATFEFFKENSHYNRLSEFEKIFVELFWTKRYCNHSVREIAEDLGLNKKYVFILLKLLAVRGAVNPEKKFLKDTNIQSRTHNPLTKLGKKLMDAIVKKAWKGIPISKSLNLGIVMVDGVPKLEELLHPLDKKKLGLLGVKDDTKKVKEYFEKKGVKVIVETLYRLSLLRSDNKKKYARGNCSSRGFSFEKGKISCEYSIWNPSLFDSGAIATKTLSQKPLDFIAEIHACQDTAEYRRRKALIAEYADFKNCARRALFHRLGAGNFYDKTMHIGIWRALEKEPIEKITKVLKLMRKKIYGGKKVKSLLGFFTHLMKNPEGFTTSRARIYRDALDGKKTPETDRLMSGQTCAEFVALARKMEAKSGQKVDTKTLAWMLGRGDSQVWLKAMRAVKFRMHLDTPRKAKTQTENIYENVTMREEYTEEVAVRDESGKLKRDDSGGILWEKRILEKTRVERRVVGTREVPVEVHGKAPKEKVNSWVGLWVYAVKLGSVKKIDEKFFQKREKKEEKAPPKEDFDYELVDDEPEGTCGALT